MTFANCSLPPEADDPPPEPPCEADRLVRERDRLLGLVRPRVRSQRQDRIRRRITEITTHLLHSRDDP